MGTSFTSFLTRFTIPHMQGAADSESVCQAGLQGIISVFLVSFISFFMHFLLILIAQGAVDGKSVRQAGLRGMNGIFLAYVDCADGTPLHAVPPETVLHVSFVPLTSGGNAGQQDSSLHVCFKMQN